MAPRTARVCGQPGCPEIVVGASRCPAHQPPQPKRGSSTQQGYGSKWRKARAEFLALHPRCECKEHKGKANAPASTDVDHIIPHRGNRELFWNRRNWQARAHACHSKATATFDGGFGNATRAGKDRLE
jgi:5-methylcytosine-specific restriction protein A